MKLAAIYNVWDGVELLRGSMETMKNDVDVFIIVYQTVSNFGEHYDPVPDMDLSGFKCVMVPFTPQRIGGAYNETLKRNLGLRIAQQEKCTHFLHLDCDEYYKDFAAAKQEYLESGKNGSVCPIFCYFKRPTWRFSQEEGYFVPFIHKLWPDSKAGDCKYPYYADPTRRINTDSVAKLSHFMHHFSWVRKDIERKARNSSAGNLLNNHIIMEDYHSKVLESSPEGFYCRNFDRKITVVDDYFGLTDCFSTVST